jgi:competence protein ComEC
VALLAVLAYLLGWAIEPLLWHLAAWPVEQLLPVARDWIKGSDGWMYGYFSADLVQVLLALLAVMLLALPLCSRRKLLVCVLALPLLLPRPQSPAMEASTTRVTVLDVGQGTAVVIRAGDRAMLYDTGGGDPAGANMATSVILPYLRSTGVTRLDTFVVSHSDMDHSAGMRTILQALPVGRVYLGAGLSVAGGTRSCVAGQAWRWPGGQHFQFLSPALEPGLATNDGSCVLQIDIGSRRLLLPGDIEHARERTLLSYWRDRLRSDWLLVAHHGSLTSSTRTLLKTVQPATVVISSGYANRFGHPHPEILQRLYDGAAAVWITADSGALEFRFTPGRPPEVQAYRQIKRRFWM